MHYKIVGTILLYLSVIFYAHAQKHIHVAPLNPDYIHFLEEKKSDDSGVLQVAPSPYLHNFKKFNNKDIKEKDFPIAFDLRYAGPDSSSYMTPVKHQQGCGACWAFATIGSIESSWKKADYGAFDLSENNLKNCSGFDLLPCDWGHHFMSTAYLVRGHGPVSEADDPYDDTNGPCTFGLSPNAFLPTARYLPEDNAAFKEAIMSYGGVYNTIRFDGDYFNSETNTLCYTGGGTTSHAVVICGWNDTVTTDCGQGVWIAKNSYGPDVYDDGYFNIAYQDTLVLKYNATWPVREDYDSSLIIHQYDTIGGWPFVGYLDSVAYGLIKFTIPQDEYIFQLGTYTTSFGTTLKAEIYQSFSEGVLSDLLAITSDYYCDNPGFWTLQLDEPLLLNEGEDVFVKVKYNAPGAEYPMAVEGFDPGYSSPHLTTGKCWVSADGIDWESAGEGEENEFDVCIKAYAYEPLLLDLKVFLEGPFDEINMRVDINNILPLFQPYNISPWNYFGDEVVESIPNENIVDWVLIELREIDGPPELATEETIINRRAGFLTRDGFITALDGISPLLFEAHIRDNLYVVVYHRNHLPIMSAAPLEMSSGIFSYDFTDIVDKAYGGINAMKELNNGLFGMIAGDGNPNAIIDIDDLVNSWRQTVGNRGYEKADFNLNTEVNNIDKNDIWEENEGKVSQIPQ